MPAETEIREQVFEAVRAAAAGLIVCFREGAVMAFVIP